MYKYATHKMSGGDRFLYIDWGWSDTNVIPHHLGELSRAIWYRTSRDNIERFSCRGEVVVSLIFGDWYHCLEGIRLIWQFTHNNKTMLVVYDTTLSNHTSLHKIHPMHHISSLVGGGSGGTAHYWVITLTTTVYNQMVFSVLIFWHYLGRGFVNNAFDA